MIEQYKFSDEEQLELAYLNLDLENITISIKDSPLFTYEDDPVLQVLKLIRNPLYLPFTCKAIFNLELLPTHHAVMMAMFQHTFPMLVGTRGFGKSFSLALYVLYRLLINQGIKIVVVGAAYRQSKLIYNYCESIWANAPILKDVCSGNKNNGCRKGLDKCYVRIGDSQAVFLPIGDGSTIRGERANIIISDEFSMINPEVYEVVIKGFGAVSNDPINSTKRIARMNLLKKKGRLSAEAEQQFLSNMKSNQSIISGTAYYTFNSFYTYFKKYTDIIHTGFDKKRLKQLFPDGIPVNHNPQDYCVIRIPVELAPEGFLDMKQLDQTKLMVSKSIYDMEYHAIFADDSDGFFRRRLIESCVIKDDIKIGENIVSPFKARLFGLPGCKYVMGIDPASEKDNFSIIILECYGNYRKIIYSWTTTRKRMNEKVDSGLIEDAEFYHLCAKKIRELYKLFPGIEIIAMDTQGGGWQVMESLRITDRLAEGELPILPIQSWHKLSDGTEYPTDGMAGLHIIEPVNFSNAQYTNEANHGLKSDFESKILLFPYFDAIALARAENIDEETGRQFDSLEDCMMDIESLKDELATIQHTQVGVTMRDRWDTPEVKTGENKKGRLRKDRYSALLMANMAARRLHLTPTHEIHQGAGGTIGNIGKSKSILAYNGPAWFDNRWDIGCAIRK